MSALPATNEELNLLAALKLMGPIHHPYPSFNARAALTFLFSPGPVNLLLLRITLKPGETSRQTITYPNSIESLSSFINVLRKDCVFIWDDGVWLLDNQFDEALASIKKLTT